MQELSNDTSRSAAITEVTDFLRSLRASITTRLMDWVDLMAQRIAADYAPVSWAGWIIYALEALALQDRASEEEYTDFLRSLRASITTRLEEGQW